MLTFNITLEPATLHKLAADLSRLATGVTYRPGTPGVLNIDNFDPADETRIVDIITDALPTVRDLPDFGDLAREATRTKRVAWGKEKDTQKRRYQREAWGEMVVTL